MLLDTFLSLISNMTLTAQGKHFFVVFWHFFGTILALFGTSFYLLLFMLLDTFLSLIFNMTLTARGKNIFVGFLALFSQRIKILFPNTK